MTYQCNRTVKKKSCIYIALFLLVINIYSCATLQTNSNYRKKGFVNFQGLEMLSYSLVYTDKPLCDNRDILEMLQNIYVQQTAQHGFEETYSYSFTQFDELLDEQNKSIEMYDIYKKTIRIQTVQQLASITNTQYCQANIKVIPGAFFDFLKMVVVSLHLAEKEQLVSAFLNDDNNIDSFIISIYYRIAPDNRDYRAGIIVDNFSTVNKT